MNKEVIEGMRDLLKVQGYDGNWNYSPYMHGMYNGMELMLSMVEGRAPEFRDKPNEWVQDKNETHTVVREGDKCMYDNKD